MTARSPWLRAVSRRQFLRLGAAGACAFLGLPALDGCGNDGVGSGGTGGLDLLGPLQAADANGVMLPTGFTSRIVARSGQAPIPGAPFRWHGAPDGGACYAVAGSGGHWIYVSNAELPLGAGGASALRFDASGALVDAYPILRSTSRNCAGGRMGPDIWLSCEENQDAGEVYECDVLGVRAAVARPALGRFNHEAVALDPAANRLYLTEDRPDGGFYRFTPSALAANGYPDLASGQLQVAEVVGGGPAGAVLWHPVPDPGGLLVPTRHQVAAMTPFNRGEGVAYHAGAVYFATTGDNRIWRFDVSAESLTILYDDDAAFPPILTGVDNIEISSAGDVLVAEDGGDMQIVAITPSSAVVPVCELSGHGLSEITGPAFSPDGSRLYFSSQRGTTGNSDDGVTFEIAGPFYG